MKTWFAYLKRGLERTRPEDRIAGNTDDAGLVDRLENLQPFVARHWRKGLLGILFVAVTTLLTLPAPLIYRYLIDDVILARRLDLLVTAVVLIGIVQGVGILSNMLEQFYFERFAQAVLLDIQQDLLDRTLRFPKSFFDDAETGYLMSRLLPDVRGLHWFFSGTLVYVATNIFRLLGGTILLVYLEWKLAVFTLLVLPGLAFTMRYFSDRLHTLGHRSMEQEAKISQTVQESLSSVFLIKAFSSEKRTLGRMLQQLEEARQIAMEQVTVNSLANLLLDIQPQVARAAVVVAGAIWIVRGEWTLGSLLAYQSYLGYVFGPAQYLASANLQFQNARAALDRVSALFEITPEENPGVGKKVERLKGDIEFRNVSFSYDGRDPVVQDLSFRALPGEHIAIVGPSGVGKTTLLSLLLRFYKPMRGEIYFDGLAASDYEVSSLRQRIGYVPQSTQLLAGTVMENLRYGSPDASEAQVFQAARAAGIHDFIAALQGGYQARVGEKGVNLSEGQKQRLAIARALVKCPDILVLDEPTSALDGSIEKSILDALPEFMRDKTLFIVAHRAATIQGADRILLLNDKRLIAVGTHAELQSSSEFYRTLFTI